MQILRKCIAESLAEPLETPFECAWNGTYHVLISVIPDVLVVPDLDLVIISRAAFVYKRLVL